MKKKFFCLLLIFSLLSCNQVITDKDIAKINGYWEIEKVILPNGEKKLYKMNETIDYFEVKNNKGFRKKVTPQFDGSYLVNNEFEAISISKKENLYSIKYKTKYASFEEKIIEIRDSILVLKNDSLEYHYKKSIPFSVK